MGIEKETLKNEEEQFDFSYLYEVADNDEAFVTEMIQLFLVNVPESLDTIEKTFSSNQADELKRELHKLKSSLALLGINEGLQLIASLNTSLVSDADVSKNRDTIHALLSLCEKVLHQLKAI
jgi:HPt (histidine-containing phosphotransfer) domain-containing protein